MRVCGLFQRLRMWPCLLCGTFPHMNLQENIWVERNYIPVIIITSLVYVFFIILFYLIYTLNFIAEEWKESILSDWQTSITRWRDGLFMKASINKLTDNRFIFIAWLGRKGLREFLWWEFIFTLLLEHIILQIPEIS